MFNDFDNSILLNGNIPIGIVYIDRILSISKTRTTLGNGGDNRHTRTHEGCLPTQEFSLKIPILMKKKPVITWFDSFNACAMSKQKQKNNMQENGSENFCEFLEDKKRNRSADYRRKSYYE